MLDSHVQNEVYSLLKSGGGRKRARKPRVPKEKRDSVVDGKSVSKERTSSRPGKRTRASSYGKPIETLADLLAHSRKRKFVATILDDASLHTLFPESSATLPSAVEVELELNEDRLTEMLQARKTEITSVCLIALRRIGTDCFRDREFSVLSNF